MSREAYMQTVLFCKENRLLQGFCALLQFQPICGPLEWLHEESRNLKHGTLQKIVTKRGRVRAYAEGVQRILQLRVKDSKNINAANI